MNAALILALLGTWGTVPGSEGTAPVLQPADYASPSGEFVLHVDPTHRLGKGAGRYRMSHNGSEVWSAERPFTFWKALVTDEGWAAGYAYTAGLHDYGAKGAFQVASFSPDGEVVSSHVTPRRESGMDTPAEPLARGLFLDADSRRFAVRVLDPDESRSEEWWWYDLAGSDRLEVVRPEHQVGSIGGRSRRIQDVRCLDGVPLALLWWWQVDRSRTPVVEEACFSLVDGEGREVWSLVFPDDYEFRGDSAARWATTKRVRDQGALLEVGREGRFSLWEVRDRGKLDLQVRELGDGQWDVTTLGESAYEPSPADPPEEPAPPPRLELPLIASTVLGGDVAGKDDLGSMGPGCIDGLGRVLVQDRNTGVLHAFDGTGRRLFAGRPQLYDFGMQPTIREILVDATGAIFIPSGRLGRRVLELSPEGERVGWVDLAAKEIAFAPDGSEWRGSSDYDDVGVQRVKAGQVLADVHRTPSGRWLGNIVDLATDTKGDLGVLTSPPLFSGGDFESGLALYGPDGSPKGFAALPPSSLASLAMSDEWAVVEPDASDTLLVRRADGAVFAFQPSIGKKGSLWRYGFPVDGKELWGIESMGPTLHRFALP